MRAIMQTARSFLRREDGPTTVEYAVMLGVIVFAAFASLSGFGTSVWDLYSTIESSMPS